MHILELAAFLAAAHAHCLLFALAGDDTSEATERAVRAFLDDARCRVGTLPEGASVTGSLRASAQAMVTLDPRVPANMANPLRPLSRRFLLELASALDVDPSS